MRSCGFGDFALGASSSRQAYDGGVPHTSQEVPQQFVQLSDVTSAPSSQGQGLEHDTQEAWQPSGGGDGFLDLLNTTSPFLPGDDTPSVFLPSDGTPSIFPPSDNNP